MDDTSIPKTTFADQIRAVEGEPKDRDKFKKSYFTKRGILDLADLTANGFIPIDPLTLSSDFGVHYVADTGNRPSKYREALITRPRNQDGTFALPNQYMVFNSVEDRVRSNIKGAEQRASYYGNTINPNRVFYHESYFKAYTASKALPDAMHVGLNGVDGYSKGKDEDGVSQPVDNLIPAFPCQDTIACIVPDAKHGRRVKGAIGRLSELLRPHFTDVTLASLPGAEDDWDLNDVLTSLGEASLKYFLENAATLFPDDKINWNDYVVKITDPNVAPPEPHWLLKYILPRKSGVFPAPGDEGKTTYWTAIALDLALGNPIFGITSPPQAALFVTAEDSAEDIHRNIHLILQSRNVTLTEQQCELLQRNFHILDAKRVPIGGLLKGSAFDPWEAGPTLLQLDAYLAHHPYISLVVLDNLAALGIPEDKSINEAFAAYHRKCNALSEAYDLAIVGVCHIAQQAALTREVRSYCSRGGTACEDNARWVHQYQRDRGDNDERRNWPSPDVVDRDAVQQGEQRLYRVHPHKVKFSPLHKDTPLWVWCPTGYEYYTLGALDGGQITSARAEAAQARQDAPARALYDAIRGEIESGNVVLRSTLKNLAVEANGRALGEKKKQVLADEMSGGTNSLLRREDYTPPTGGKPTIRYFLNEV